MAKVIQELAPSCRRGSLPMYLNQFLEEESPRKGRKKEQQITNKLNLAQNNNTSPSKNTQPSIYATLVPSARRSIMSPKIINFKKIENNFVSKR
jgi:hypothetical protein